MKVKIKFLGFCVLFILVAATIKTTEKPKYIYLNAEQLHSLGIELSKKGLFYLNCNPQAEENKEYPYLALYSTKGNYVSSILSQYISSDIKCVFKNKKVTNYDFYPMLVGNPKNHYAFDREVKDKKLVPIAVCMSEAKILNRADTLIFWFKPTESFRKALPKGIVMEDYLRLPDTIN